MLHDVLADDEVKSLVGESLPLDVLTAVSGKHRKCREACVDENRWERKPDIRAGPRAQVTNIIARSRGMLPQLSQSK